ncbi:ABC transporter ATP-binding protein [Arthrobacter tecti]
MTDHRLAAQDLSFGYGPISILHNWSESFRSGEVVALTGPSGRGKSTLLYLLGLMVRPTAGQLYLDGRNITGVGDTSRARLRAHRFGFVFQDAALDPTRSVLDNVIEAALYRGQDRRQAATEALRLLNRFDVQLRATHKPTQVSGGQAQRIAICRALLSDPMVLLADEPTGNLDHDSAEVVIDALHGQAARGAAVVVATHDPTLMARCDRRIEL